MTCKNSTTKLCTRCGETKLVSEFYKYTKTKDGCQFHCKPCKKEETLMYHRTKAGLVSKIYSSQKSNSKKRGHEMPSYSKQELESWMFNQSVFHKLYYTWVNLGFSKMLTPSCDRLNDCKGYTFSNLRITTWSENSKKGYEDRKNGIDNRGTKAVLQFSLDGSIISEYHSISQAFRDTGVMHSSICECCKGKYKTAGGFVWEYASNAQV